MRLSTKGRTRTLANSIALLGAAYEYYDSEKTEFRTFQRNHATWRTFISYQSGALLPEIAGCDLSHIRVYTYTYTCIYIYIYVYIHIHIRVTTLCCFRASVTRPTLSHLDSSLTFGRTCIFYLDHSGCPELSGVSLISTPPPPPPPPKHTLFQKTFTYSIYEWSCCPLYLLLSS